MSRADLIAESAMDYAQDRESERRFEVDAARYGIARDSLRLFHKANREACEASIIALANQMIAERSK